MINAEDVWILKPSREGQTIGGKALFAGSLSQADIQRYKNQGYAHWFMLKPVPPKVEPSEPGRKDPPKDTPREEGESRTKARPTGIEKLEEETKS